MSAPVRQPCAHLGLYQGQKLLPRLRRRPPPQHLLASLDILSGLFCLTGIDKPLKQLPQIFPVSTIHKTLLHQFLLPLIPSFLAAFSAPGAAATALSPTAQTAIPLSPSSSTANRTATLSTLWCPRRA